MKTTPEEGFYDVLTIGKPVGKIGVDREAGPHPKRPDPKRKRHSTLARYEMAKRSAEFFETWPDTE